MNNPFDYIPDARCNEAFSQLTHRIESLKRSNAPEDIRFYRELKEGKMLGVLIATDNCGAEHILYAFSGQLGNGGFHYPGFVEPVFDYLQPDGYFKRHEADISRQNKEIAMFESGVFSKIRNDFESIRKEVAAEISEHKERYRLAKLRRATKRSSGINDESELAEMIRQSQFEKAELHRHKIRMAAKLEPYSAEFKKAQDHLTAMKAKRRSESEGLQEWLFSNFKMLNARGESRSLIEIFADTPMRIPPSGAGECCAPKLLQAAYRRGLTPVAMAEYWYGNPKSGELRIHGMHYPACRGKCVPVLSWMLQGLDIESGINEDYRPTDTHEPKILYENQWFCVVDKPSGMLSVPGKSAELSLQQWLADKYGEHRCVKMAHRLDQDTSGIIIATFGEESYKAMQSIFAGRIVRKTYIAVLEGNYESSGTPVRGQIDLPLSPDWLDRPRQKIDRDNGKTAVTDYEFLGATGCYSHVRFYPLTGRTHQLRVHAASADGLGIPIAGDRLYGRNRGCDARRLMLHAHKIEFTFPLDGQHYSFESPVPF